MVRRDTEETSFDPLLLKTGYFICLVAFCWYEYKNYERKRAVKIAKEKLLGDPQDCLGSKHFVCGKLRVLDPVQDKLCGVKTKEHAYLERKVEIY